MIAMAPAPESPSSATARARALVADRKPAALELGRRAGADIADPAVVVARRSRADWRSSPIPITSRDSSGSLPGSARSSVSAGPCWAPSAVACVP